MSDRLTRRKHHPCCNFSNVFGQKSQFITTGRKSPLSTISWELSLAAAYQLLEQPKATGTYVAAVTTLWDHLYSWVWRYGFRVSDRLRWIHSDVRARCGATCANLRGSQDNFYSDITYSRVITTCSQTSRRTGWVREIMIALNFLM